MSNLDLVASNILFPRSPVLGKGEITNFFKKQTKSASKSCREQATDRGRIRRDFSTGKMREREFQKEQPKSSRAKQDLKFTFRNKPFVSQANNYVDFFKKNLQPPHIKKSKSISRMQGRGGVQTMGGFRNSVTDLQRSPKIDKQIYSHGTQEYRKPTKSTRIERSDFQTNEHSHFFKKEMPDMPTIFKSEIEQLKGALKINNKYERVNQRKVLPWANQSKKNHKKTNLNGLPIKKTLSRKMVFNSKLSNQQPSSARLR